MTTPSPSADRNLIFGLLALQMDFVSREQLLDAMHSWMLAKHRPLGELLVERGVLVEEDRSDIDRLVQKHLKRHGDDPQASLAALRIDPAVRQQLHGLDDPEVQASVQSLSAKEADTNAKPPLPQPGTPRFTWLRPHKVGGLAVVSVARDEEIHREVALKEIKNALADHAKARSRFVSEAEITGQLEHPGVVPIYGMGVYPDGRPYYAMRFIRGDSLHDAIERFHQADHSRRDPGERSLALRDLLTRFVVVCQTVAYAHACGVIHRDLKPANIMLGDYGETIVVDWGLARVLAESNGEATVAERPVLVGGSDDSAARTAMGEAMGTPAYMPPEQAEGQLDRIGPTSDVFGLGAILYHLLTGQPPYQGDDVLAQARQARIVPAQQRERSVPRALEAICVKALAREQKDRYPTAKALAREVEHWLADEPVEAYGEPVSDRLRRWGRQHRSLVSSGLVLLLAIVVGVCRWACGQWPRSRPGRPDSVIAP